MRGTALTRLPQSRTPMTERKNRGNCGETSSMRGGKRTISRIPRVFPHKVTAAQRTKYMRI